MMRRLTCHDVVWGGLLGTPASAQTLYWAHDGAGTLEARYG